MRFHSPALNRTVLAVAGLLLPFAASAAVFEHAFTAPSPLTTTAQNVVISTAGDTGRIRAFYVTGNWTGLAGNPFSNEFRVQIPGLTSQGGGALDRSMGGLANGNPFVFASPSLVTNNAVGVPAGMLANIPAADLGGDYTIALRQTFAGSTANLANAAIRFYTDATAPVAVALDGTSPFMTQRPSSTTTLFGPVGQYRYQAVPFVAAVGGAHHFGLYTGGADAILLVYQGSFDPASPLTNLIGYNDVGSIGDSNSSNMWLSLTAGQSYVVVPTTFTSNAAMPNGLQTIAGPELSSFTVGGTVTGLTGTGLVLQNNKTDDLLIAADGSFTFATPVASGSDYAVTVLTEPGNPSQTCVVSNGAGTVAAADITDVAVNCASETFTIGGTVSGLAGTGLVLRNNGGDNLSINANGGFTFTTPVASGDNYAVTVFTQPSNPTQTCVVSNGAGTVGAANVTNVAVNCTTNTFSIGGTVSGLAGTGLVLRNNGGNNLAINANGAFTFTTPVASGAAYAVTVFTQPSNPTQTCVVSNGAGTVGAANVTNVAVNCTTNTFTIGGTVSGLAGAGLVLSNNGGNNLTINGNGAFSFTTPIASGATYAVTVLTQPTALSQTCVVTNGAGTVTDANVTNVAVACTTNSFAVGGTLTGLPPVVGSVTLSLNNGDPLQLTSNGAFTFPGELLDGSAYAVTLVSVQPGLDQLVCVLENANGTVSGATINVNVVCSFSPIPIPTMGFTGLFLMAGLLLLCGLVSTSLRRA